MPDMKFIYVPKQDEYKSKMLLAGYELFPQQRNNNFWVFVSNDMAKFEIEDVPHVLSSTLTFHV